ncbi:MAG: DUF4258 domain-containing protein [Gemmatimonadaceae bacterium]
MTHKQVTYTDHASDQLKERGLTRPDVRRLLAIGMRRPDPEPGYESKWIREAYIRGQEAGICYAEYPDRIKIITVYWVER